MSRRSAWAIGGALVGFFALSVAVSAPRAQQQGHGEMSPAAPQGAAAQRKVTMEELHRQGGVPRGWKFALPAGDPAKGRQLFADLECYKCHAIQGEGFPPAGGGAKERRPEPPGL